MNKKERNPVGISIGIPTLAMVFVVLCLTALSVLSLVTARNQLGIARRAQAAVTNFYVADGLAEQILAAAEQDVAAGNFPKEVYLETKVQCRRDEASFWLSFAVPIDENKNLLIEAVLGEATQIKTWKIVHESTSQAEQTLPVWNGEA